MRFDSRIEAQLRDFPLKYEVEVRRRHVFLHIEGHPSLIVSGHGNNNSNCRWIPGVVAKLRRIRKEREGGDN